MSNSRGRGPQPERDLVGAARELAQAWNGDEWVRIKQRSDDIFRALGLSLAEIERSAPKDLLNRMPGGDNAMLVKSVAGFAIRAHAMALHGYPGNNDGERAFALAERALVLNPLNPDQVRSLWTILRRNQREGPTSADFGEMDREFVTVMGSLERYLTEGLRLRPPDFQIPPGWRGEAHEWRRYGGWAVENLAAMQFARSIELRKRRLDLVETLALQDSARVLCERALELSGAEWSQSAVSSMAHNREDGRWKKIDKTQLQRVRRVFQTLAKLSGAKRNGQIDQARYESAARVAEDLGRGAPIVKDDHISLEQLLSRDRFMKPAPLEAKVETNAVPTEPQNREPLARAAEPPAKLPPVPREARGHNGKAAPAGPPKDFATFLSAQHRDISDRVQLDVLEAFARKVMALKLPEALPEKEAIGATARAVQYAAAASLLQPSEAAKLLVDFAARARASADDDPSTGALLELIAIRAALLALKAKSGGLDRMAKTSVDREVPALLEKASEVAELVDAERLVPRIVQVFDQVRLSGGSPR